MLTFAEARKKHFGDEKPVIAVTNWQLSRGEGITAEEYVKMKFPYQTSDELPAPIPTVDEIEMARNTVNNLTAYRGIAAFHPVYRLHDVYAVKFSCGPQILQEAENLLFLEQHSKVRVPKVYAVFSHQGGDPEGFIKAEHIKRSELPLYHYLVMEYVEGKNYQSETEWNKLSLKAKENLCGKIGQQLNLLQEIPAPSPPYYGRINYQGFNPHNSILASSGPGFHGPYESHEDFVHDVYNNCEVNCACQSGTDYDHSSKIFLEGFKRCMKNISGQEPRLTHTDLFLQNVIAQPKKDDPEDFDVVIIDWATMAWLPTYVQAATVLRGCPNKAYEHLYAWEMSQGIKPFPCDAACYFNRAMPGMYTHIE